MGLFGKVISKFKQGLERTREVLVSGAGGIKSLLLGRKLDEQLIDELEKALLQADVGVVGTKKLVDGIREDFKQGKMSRGEDVLEYLKREMKAMWPPEDRELHFVAPGASFCEPNTIMIRIKLAVPSDIQSSSSLLET